jgi:hypothetical protein
LYITNLDPVRYEKKGCDYCNSYFDPERIGKKLADIDISKDYDFRRLERKRLLLWGIDRLSVLRYIFERVTNNAVSNTDKHIAVLRFLQKSSFHNHFPPLYPSGEEVDDPLLCLALSEMWCSNVAMLAIDLFSAAGYPGRLIQLSGHQIAEIFYDNKWHYFDADLFSGGHVVTLSDGHIPSVEELSQGDNYKLLDQFPTYAEKWIMRSCRGLYIGSGTYGASYAYFSQKSYEISGVKKERRVKLATKAQEKNDFYHYGWSDYSTEPDSGRILHPLHLRFHPSVPSWKMVKVDKTNRKVFLSVKSHDEDDDLLGYRVYISTRSRGWKYPTFFGDDKLKVYWDNSAGWNPSMYDLFHQTPPADIGIVVSKDGRAEIDLPSNKGNFYISVMPFDAYGESVGMKLYPVSNELKISL